jgi:hypothetical protein
MVVTVCRGGWAQAGPPEPKAITARLHGTFVDRAGGLGVLSGDMTLARFEVRNNVLTAIGEMDGALADSAGNVLGPVNQEIALLVTNVDSSCNQLRLQLEGAELDLFEVRVRLDKQVAGYDSRVGAAPKQEPTLCVLAEALRGSPAPAVVAADLNSAIAAVAAR